MKGCTRMCEIGFPALADHLRHGREIEFVYNARAYSITNHSGFWHLCDDTSHILLETLCPFEEKEALVAKIAAYRLEALTIQQIFDEGRYDRKRLCVL